MTYIHELQCSEETISWMRTHEGTEALEKTVAWFKNKCCSEDAQNFKFV